MKTLVHAKNNLSAYIWADDFPVTVTENMTLTPEFNIGDMNSTNSVMFENVTPPDDWAGCKYLYDAGTWTLNPNWVDPNTPSA